MSQPPENFTITLRDTPHGSHIAIKGSASRYSTACLARELMRGLSERVDPSNVTEDGLLLIGEIVNKLHQLTDDGRHFRGVIFVGAPKREHGPGDYTKNAS